MKKVIIVMTCLIMIFTLNGCFKFQEPSIRSDKRVETEALIFDYSSSDETYGFLWNTADDPYLLQLKEEFQLNTLIAGCDQDIDKVIAITNWVHHLWKHDGNNVPPKGDPISILRDVMNGKRYRCVEYGTVIFGCLNALGLKTRIVGLKTKDVETRKSGAGHVIAEVYLNDLDKWVFVDAQWNAIPSYEGTPLNSVEFQKHLSLDPSSIKILNLSPTD